MSFEYVREYYDVPAEVGRRVEVGGKPGVIVADRGNYIGVNFDEDAPGVVKNAHPTYEVEYLGMGPVRKKKTTPAQRRYQDYISSEYGGSFPEFLGLDRCWECSKPGALDYRHRCAKCRKAVAA